jgi:hypothetical protein
MMDGEMTGNHRPSRPPSFNRAMVRGGPTWDYSGTKSKGVLEQLNRWAIQLQDHRPLGGGV